MNDNNDFKIPDFDLGIKKAAKSITANGSAIVSILAIVIAAMLFFTDISGGFNLTASFSVTGGILLCLCIVEYYSNKRMGMQEAKKEQTYIDVMSEHKELSEECQRKCSSRGITAFCLDYAEEDLVRRRTAILRQVDLTYEEYAQYIGKKKKELPKDMPHHTKKCVNKANRQKLMYLSQDNLVFSVSTEKEARLMLSTTSREIQKDLFFLIPATASAVFSVGVLAQVITDFSFATITMAMIKIFCLIFNAIKGYQTGFYNIAEGQVQCTRARIYLLKECITRKDGTTEETNN